MKHTNNIPLKGIASGSYNRWLGNRRLTRIGEYRMSSKVVLACALVAMLSFPTQRGVTKDVPPLHKGPWPIYNGFNHQPTQEELRALHRRDVTLDQARKVERLYDQLLSNSEKILSQQPALVH